MSPQVDKRRVRFRRQATLLLFWEGKIEKLFERKLQTMSLRLNDGYCFGRLNASLSLKMADALERNERQTNDASGDCESPFDE